MKKDSLKPDKPTMIKISNRIASYPRYAELERLPEIIGKEDSAGVRNFYGWQKENF